MITAVIALALIAAGFYGVLRFVFPKAGELGWLALVLGFLGLSIGLSWLIPHGGDIALVGVILIGIFRSRVAAFLTDCGLTRERVETIAGGLRRNR